MELTREYVLRYQQAYRRNRNPSKKTLLRLARMREQGLQLCSGKPPSKRFLARRDGRSTLHREMLFSAMCRADWLRRLGVQPQTSATDDSHWMHLAGEITRWTNVRLSATEIANDVTCTDCDLLIREAVRRREEYLDKAIADRRQREAAIQRLNETDRAAADAV